MLVWLPAILLAYMVGAIPFGVLIARAKGVDIRQHGSKNTGATNVGRVLGFRYFLLCFALDMLKGLGPTLGAGLAAGVAGRRDISANDAWLWLAVMAAAVLGHMFSPFLRFKGGKGVATGLGALLGVFPVLTIAAAIGAVVWGVLFAVWRYVSLASIGAAVSLPISVAALTAIDRGASWNAAAPYLIVSGLLALLVVVRHRANIARLLEGQEHRIGSRPASPPAPTPRGSPPAGP